MSNSGFGQRRSWSTKAAACAVLVLVSVLGSLAIAQQPVAQSLEAVNALALQDEPVADAGPDQNITRGTVAVLNGSNSFGFEGPESLNYTWSARYQSQTKTYYGMVVPVRFNQTGLANISLTVRDSLNRTDTDIVRVFVNEPAPTFLKEYGTTILGVSILGAIGGVVLFVVVGRIVRGEPVVSDAGREKARLNAKKYMKILREVMKSPMGFIGVVILVFFMGMAAFGPMLAPYSISLEDQADRYMKPTPDHWMGTDNLGFDVFSELLIGARTSMIVGLVSALIASVLGALVGLYSGYAGGWKDEVVMRLNDVVLSIPWLVLMIIVAAFVGKIDLTGIVLIIGLTGWSYTARMVRAQVLSVKERQYIERSRSIGAGELDIIRRHIFPNTFPLIFANTILTVAVSILSESTLSFLGMRPVNEVTWGTMLAYAEEASAFERGLTLWIVVPGLCIVVVVLGFTLLGYALDEILNPKLRHR